MFVSREARVSVPERHACALITRAPLAQRGLFSLGRFVRNGPWYGLGEYADSPPGSKVIMRIYPENEVTMDTVAWFLAGHPGPCY